MTRTGLLKGTRQCEGRDTVDAARCSEIAAAAVKGKWLCHRHAATARTASESLVATTVGRCPRCGRPTVREEVAEQPLLRHGASGAARRTVTEHCEYAGCRWWLTTEVSEERPEVHR